LLAQYLLGLLLWGVATSETHTLAYLLRNLAVEVDAKLSDALSPYGLSAAQWRVLSAVASGKASSPAEISNLQDIDSGSTSRMVRRLELSGLLEREEDPVDRRAVRLRLSPKATQLLPRASLVAEEFYREVVAGMAPYEIEHLRALLQRLLSNVRQVF
jgi:MarR family transcriptional regulator, multiple antibiotic resistance protein MarR